MKLLKRVLAGISAVAMLTSPSTISSYTVFAEEETEVSVSDSSEPSPTESTDSTDAEGSDSVVEEVTPSSQPVTTPETTVITEPSVTSEPEPTTEEPTKDLSAPDLTVDIPPDWQKNTSNWIVSTSEGATLYYELSDDEFNNANDMPDSVIEWNDGASLPQGEHNIRVWAKYPDDERQKAVSNTWKYKLDSTAPTSFQLEQKISNNPFHRVLTIKNDKPIIEEGSGIAEIYYTVNGGQKVNVNFSEVDGKIDFSFDLDSSLREAAIIVTVVDKATNSSSASLNVNDFDAQAPNITNVQVVNVTYSEQDKEQKNPIESEQENHAFGHKKLENYTDFIYVNQNSYLKIAVDDNFDYESNELNIVVSVDGNEISFSDEDLKKANSLSKNGVYYISLNNSDFNLESSKDYEISVSADNGEIGCDPVQLSNNIYYDAKTTSDSKISSSFSGNYLKKNGDKYEKPGLDSKYDVYFGETDSESGNKMSVYISDDVGIGKYEIKVNGTVVKQENLYDGRKTSGTYSEEVTDEDGNISTNKTDVDYQAISKFADPYPYSISFTRDGEYSIEITVEDLAGNKNVETLLVCVDTTAPVISGVQCRLVNDSTFLHYVTFGIYGKDSITLKLKVDNDFSGVLTENIKLFWDREEPYAATYDANSGYYIFDSLDIGGKAKPRIEITDGMENGATYYFGTINDNSEHKFDNIVSLTTEIPENEICLILESNAPKFTVSYGGNYSDSANESGELYFGNPENGKENSLTVSVKDDEGIDNYQITITDSNGKMMYEKKYDLIDNADAAILSHISDAIDIDYRSGKYTLTVIATDLAGNETPEGERSRTFYIDTDAPIIENTEYQVVDNILKYFTFGIFGNEAITISVDVKDNETGCGIKNVSLYWAESNSDELIEYNSTFIDGKYVFDKLPIDCEAVPYIKVVDNMENVNAYYFVSVESGSEEKNAGQLILNEETLGITLVLEKNAPDISVAIPDNYTSYSVNGELWYPGDIEYSIRAIDDNAGLKMVSVQENDKITELTGVNGAEFISTRYRSEAKYIYPLTEANDYSVRVYAVDNAGNRTDDEVKEFHIDKESPQITMFKFGEEIDNGSDFEKTTYGFYFMSDTEAKVYVSDPGVSSGINGVTLYLTNVNGTEKITTVSGTDLRQDDQGLYASFNIETGFKGRVYAKVADNVEHTSELINADGNIVENNDIHQSVSSLDIHEDVDTDKQDAAGIPLYNRSIPLTITAKDSFSGIARIEWSIADDGESGVISVQNDGSYQSDSQLVTIGVVETESNLITSMQFGISVNSNTNGNVVEVKLTDRSGNTSEISKTYSIDTTHPVIEATFGNNNVQNGSYYQDPQTVNITITERNFNGSDVQILLNGAAQQVTWDDNGSTIGQDSTAHHAHFDVTADGDYTYEIQYTDRAGNEATAITSDQFTVDNTDPTADISFDIGDANLKDAYYNQNRTALFTVVEHNYLSAVIHVKKDGVDISESMGLNNWNPQDHTGDNHTQDVVFSENGYYEISIDVIDKAGRTVTKTAQGFYIDQTSPVVSVSVDNVENGAPSNEKTITPFVSVEDKEGNLDPETITLKVTAIKLDENHEIVPDIQTYIGLEEWQSAPIGKIELDDAKNPNLVTFSFNNLEDDGIYTFEVTASDKAGNTGGESDKDKANGAKYKISINRLGSTYEVDAKISEVDPNMRYFRNKEDTLFSFTITEYNVNKLKPSDTIVKMTCDGTVVENDVAATEESGPEKWSKYTYDFESELMETSGKYIVKLYSVDEAGNENPLEIDGKDERATVTFFIDNDDPTVAFRDANDKTEFTNDDPYRTDSKRIEVEVYDNSQQEARNVVFKLDDVDLTDSVEHEPGTMIYTLNIPSKSSAQNLSVSLEDIAGNHVETGVENFLITTNLFILWFKNVPLFIASIVLFFILIGGILFVIIRKARKKTRF